MEPSGQCGVQPSILFLVITLLATGAATGLLCTAIITEQWESVTWDADKLTEISNQMPQKYKIDWLLDNRVARVNLSEKLRDFQINGIYLKNQIGSAQLFFVAVSGGLWTFCTTLSGMQNLSISCALVCLIILCCSAMVGAFGVIQQQISAVLVTGVMYLLAATFAFFTLTLIHFKRVQSEAECPLNQTTFRLKLDGVFLSTNTYLQPFILSNTTKYLDARVFSTGWSLQLGWIGTGTCVLVSIMWILLSKIMRYNPLSNLLTVL